MITPPLFKIKDRIISDTTPCYIIAELSANHNQDFKQAVKLIEEAKKAGADAVKLQTYKAETITLNVDNDFFRIKSNLVWKGKKLYDLYHEAHTPWEWQPKLKEIADEINIDLFSSPFDATAVDFLESMGVPAYKIASFELIDIPLIEKVAKTGKPVILSTGMASFDEIREAVDAIKQNSHAPIALLKCTSAYPADPAEMNLLTISDLRNKFNVISGLSDHTLDNSVAIASIALGAKIIEKHFTLSRKNPGPDSSFSMEPKEFHDMVNAIRLVEKSLGKVTYGPTAAELNAIPYRRSLFATQDIQVGETLTLNNIRSVRPSGGLAPKFLSHILGAKAIHFIARGTPIAWGDITQQNPPCD